MATAPIIAAVNNHRTPAVSSPPPPPPPPAEGASAFPVPQDDGQAKHLPGHPVPSLTYLPSTEGGEEVDLFNVSLVHPVLVVVYPWVGTPMGVDPKVWDQVPGARGSTQLLSTVRDHLPTLQKHEPELVVYGLSTHPPTDQRTTRHSLSLPFHLVSDIRGELTERLDLPTFGSEAGQGGKWLKRMTLLLRGGQVTRMHYPVHYPTEVIKTAVTMLVPDEHLAPAEQQ